jgi:hypothetical protein
VSEPMTSTTYDCPYCGKHVPAAILSGHVCDETEMMQHSEDQAKRIAELTALVEAAYQEGWNSGHNEGLGCGHALAPRCRHSASDEWMDSSAKETLKGDSSE